jgi:hypothetical protein
MSAHDSGSAGERFMFVDDTLARLVGMHGVTVWSEVADGGQFQLLQLAAAS